MKLFFICLLMVFSVQNVEAKVGDDSVFTLYRNNHINPYIRVHVGTFDSENGSRYNSFHCKKVVEFFNNDAKKRASKEQHWCEKGYFKE